MRTRWLHTNFLVLILQCGNYKYGDNVYLLGYNFKRESLKKDVVSRRVFRIPMEQG